jgi:hypothetical protein
MENSRISQLLKARAATVGPPVVSKPFQMPTGILTNVVAFLFYASSTIFVLFLILTFIHFTLHPIFQLSPSEAGLLPVVLGQGAASASDWCKNPADVSQKANLGPTQSCDFTVIFDVFLDRAYTSVTAPRVLLYRSEKAIELPKSAKVADLPTLYAGTNFYAYVDSVTNDLYISVFTSVNSNTVEEKLPKITNVPMNEAFRLVIIYMPSFIEVYLNGKLQSTTTLKGRPIECTKDFWAPPAAVARSVKVGNLYYWPRPLSSQEARVAGPPLRTDFFVKTS